MTVVMSANIGGYDTPKSHVRQTVPCKITTLYESALWWIMQEKERPARTVAKEPKLRPWLFTAEPGPWIWIDGSAEIISPTFVEDVLEATTGPIGQFVHPHRDCVYGEATVSSQMLKYQNVPVLQQANHYRFVGHPPNSGLWATGVIVYKERLDYLADLWWAEINRWGYQDQISQPVALKNAGLVPDPLPYQLWSNPWIRWHAHRSDL